MAATTKLRRQVQGDGENDEGMIVETIKSIVENELKQQCTFIYAPEFEANVLTDITESETGWYFIYAPPIEVTDEIGSQQEYHTKLPFVALICKYLPNPTIDYKESEIQTYVDQAREIGRNFVHKLGENAIIDTSVETPIQQARYVSIKGSFDSHLFGVELTCDVSIYEGKTGC